MEYYIGIDDTDNLESRGTGHLARDLAQVFAQDFRLHGVTRHQLLEDERVPKTAKNSCAGIFFQGDPYPLEEIASVARKVMNDDYQPGSDPGLCVANRVDLKISAFGKQAQQRIVTQDEARLLAGDYGVLLEGLGGDQGGVIGALAAVGLLASGNDGRYVMVGDIRSMTGLHPVPAVIGAGISEVRELDGSQIYGGQVLTDKMRPARMNAKPVLFVKKEDSYWLPVKLD
jgi:tRNA(Ile2) C34 agmatinyltransferase TiaS